MSDDPSHLTPAAAELLQAPVDQRLRAILGERWVQYTRAAQVLRILDLLLDHPRTTRMPSIAVYGDSGMGKTMIMQRFRDEHPPLFDNQAGIVNGGQNPRNSGGDRKTGTELAGAIGHALPSFDPAPTAIWQPPVNAIAAEGGGRRPAFTGGCQIATLDE